MLSLTSITGADGEQQSELCQTRMDLRNQRTTKDAALSALHRRPLNSALYVHSKPDREAKGEAIDTHSFSDSLTQKQ